jgi:hypothetical protein
MEKNIFTNAANTIEYFIQGDNPNLLIISGIHGDEFEVVESVRKSIEKNKDKLGDFVYIPIASPTAFEARNRQSACGLDMNRHFTNSCKCNEAQAIMQLLKSMKIKQCVSFHEDLEHPHFYMYDSDNMEGDECLARLRKDITELGVDLLNDVDDKDDEHLGFEFIDGYAGNIPDAEGKPIGSMETWLIKEKITDRVFCIEVPGSSSKDIKDKLVEKVLYNLVIC